MYVRVKSSRDMCVHSKCLYVVVNETLISMNKRTNERMNERSIDQSINHRSIDDENDDIERLT